MPTTDLISPFVVSCAGGLTLNKDVFSMAPGEALILQNFEPDIKGGYKSSGRLRGWQFMKEFVDRNGNVYHKGVEQPKLKGTLPPTKIEKKKRLSKKEKQEYKDKAALQIANLKKELKGLRWKKDKKAVTRQIKNYTKIMNGKFTESLVTKLFS